MKKLLVVPLAIIVGVLAAVATHSGRGRAQIISVKHTVKDLPEYGISIITSSHPSFDAEMAKFLAAPGGDLGKHLEALKPLCAFLVNNGGQNVVAYKLKWELVRSDGAAKTKFSSTINPAKLTGEESPSGVAAEGELGPGMSRLVTWEPSLANVLYSLRRSQGATASSGGNKATEFLARMEEVVRQQTGPGATLNVSLDGAFFADGDFVGPDTDDSFAEVQIYIESKADLRRLAEDGKRQGKSAREVLDHIKSAFGKVDVAPSAHPAPADVKAVFMKMHADNLRRMREARGDEYAVGEIMRPPRRDAPRLRRKVN